MQVHESFTGGLHIGRLPHPVKTEQDNMDTYGLIGYPLGHSFSRNFFADKFSSENIQAQYLNFEIPDIKDIKDILAQQTELHGFNVTIPYKQQIIPYLNSISKEAAAIGAVNVVKVIRKGDKIQLKGYNSDVIGFTNSIQPLLQPHHKKALILGTGGASKAIHYALTEKMGLETLFVSRTKKPGMITYEEITPETIKEYEVIVNCSPVGMYPHVDECPALPYEAMSSSNLLYDLVYNPDRTRFMQMGEAHGAVVKNGLEMLILQAIASWEFWHGKDE